MKVPGVGHKVFHKEGKNLLMIHLLGQTFIHHQVRNPFHSIDEILSQYSNQHIDAICVDFHKEATSEVQALSIYADGRVSFV